MAAGMRGEPVRAPICSPHRPSFGEVLLASGVAAVGRRLWWALRHPVPTVLMVAVLTAVQCVGAGPVCLAAAGVGVLLAVWRWRWPAGFSRVVGDPARSRWRRWWLYRGRWQPAMVLTGLGATFDRGDYLPRLGRVRSTRWADTVGVTLLSGQCPEDYERVTAELAHTFGALRATVTVAGPGRVVLHFQRRDPLVDVVPALPIAEPVDLTAVPVGRREDGQPWTLALLGSHVLLAGSTGAGKGSVLWSLIRALAPAVRDRLVQVWAVDPKGGMELSFGAPLFTRFAYTPGGMLPLLEDAVEVMQDRAGRLRGITRRHEPTVAEPLIVVLVDELASLTAYDVDRERKRKTAAALQLLLSQGRAVGVLVAAAVQDPGKDVIPFRDLFPTRIGLRLAEDEQVDMILGRGARNRGAECDHIPTGLPGVGYVQLDTVREPVRVRAGHVTDTDIAALTADYAPQPLAEIPPLCGVDDADTDEGVAA
jgi:S-DNA-T family DNA segregation ATPase FtsK/SpoIIIE